MVVVVYVCVCGGGGGVGKHYPRLTPGLYHWMRLIITNNNIYGLGVEI